MYMSFSYIPSESNRSQLHIQQPANPNVLIHQLSVLSAVIMISVICMTDLCAMVTENRLRRSDSGDIRRVEPCPTSIGALRCHDYWQFQPKRWQVWENSSVSTSIPVLGCPNPLGLEQGHGHADRRPLPDNACWNACR
jgi:hypothetical protein